jgi:UDP-glucose 4-epimerase
MPSTVFHLSDARELRKVVKPYPIVLVTGGSGYIGSHTVLEILKTGCAVVVIDNLVNSHMEALIRVYHIAKTEYAQQGRDQALPPLFLHKVDLRNRGSVLQVFEFWQSRDDKKLDVTNIAALASGSAARYKMQKYDMPSAESSVAFDISSVSVEAGSVIAVVHFAALKAVGESVAEPLQYYQNNISGLLNLLDAMAIYKVQRMVFSSSATVYGSGKEANITEDSIQVGGKGTGGGLVTNPYGRTKWMAEEILNDCCVANPEFQVVSLRYFNPTGSHPSGLIGEDPKGTPNNIVPVILQAYQRRRSKVYVFGANYSTSDGTGVRDYIHVDDLASGHLAALRSMVTPTAALSERKQSFCQSLLTDDVLISNPNYRVYNLGTGQGYSVLDIIKAFAAAAGQDIPFAVTDARPGDLGVVTASTDKATSELGWQAEFGIQDMCRDVYTFSTQNPAGYERLRQLSILAAKDPQALRKASIATGFSRKGSGLWGLVEGLEHVVNDEKRWSQMVRKLSELSEGVALEIRRDSVMSSGSGDSDIPPHHDVGSTPQWGLFNNSWHDHSWPIR